MEVPQITTLHGRLDLADLKPLYQEFRDMPVISISDHQRSPLPMARWTGTVYNGGHAAENGRQGGCGGPRLFPRPHRAPAQAPAHRVRRRAGASRDFITFSADGGKAHFCVPSHSESVAAIERKVNADRHSRAEITTDHEQFNDWINRSVADLQMLTTQTRYGPYPYAGVPWFSTPFGRDGLITALQTLWAPPAWRATAARARL